MTTPAHAASRGDLEPGWSDDTPNGFGPCYKRHVPGQGLLRLAALGGGYGWFLDTSHQRQPGTAGGAELPPGTAGRPDRRRRAVDRMASRTQPEVMVTAAQVSRAGRAGAGYPWRAR